MKLIITPSIAAMGIEYRNMLGKRYENRRRKSARPILKSSTALRKGMSLTRKKTQFMMRKLAKNGESISVAK